MNNFAIKIAYICFSLLFFLKAQAAPSYKMLKDLAMVAKEIESSEDVYINNLRDLFLIEDTLKNMPGIIYAEKSAGAGLLSRLGSFFVGKVKNDKKQEEEMMNNIKNDKIAQLLYESRIIGSLATKHPVLKKIFTKLAENVAALTENWDENSEDITPYQEIATSLNEVFKFFNFMKAGDIIVESNGADLIGKYVDFTNKFTTSSSIKFVDDNVMLTSIFPAKLLASKINEFDTLNTKISSLRANPFQRIMRYNLLFNELKSRFAKIENSETRDIKGLFQHVNEKFSLLIAELDALAAKINESVDKAK